MRFCTDITPFQEELLRREVAECEIARLKRIVALLCEERELNYKWIHRTATVSERERMRVIKASLELNGI